MWLTILTILTLVAAAAPPNWQPWTDDAFAKARDDGQLVLLDIGTQWCHWCHVMEEQTWADADVQAQLLGFRAIKVDAEARPDLANRYEDYGWPATIVLDAAGRELVTFRGFVPPRRMAAVLAAVRADPTPGPSVVPRADVEVSTGTRLSTADRETLEQRFVDGWDPDHGGWGTRVKYVDDDLVTLALVRARGGDSRSAERARTTLDRGLALVDPVWGGVYQYSDSGDWDHPHFEKIMDLQADNLRTYAMAEALWGRATDRSAAEAIRRYLADFLTDPSGALFASQDADLVRGEHAGGYFALDDDGRRALGVPRVDAQRYGQHNGWAIDALAAHHAATGHVASLRAAEAAATWVVQNLALPDGGVRHAEGDDTPYLGDTLAMGRAFLTLSMVTGDRDWLDRASSAAAYVDAHFRADDAGFVTARTTGVLNATRQLDENIEVARWANLLAHATEDPAHRALADHALRYVTASDVALAQRIAVAGTLLADDEAGRDPMRFVVSGPGNSQRASSLFRAALADPDPYRLVTWQRDGPGPAWATVCANGVCSPALTDPAALRAAADRLLAR